MPGLQRAHAPTPAPTRPPHTSPHRPFEQRGRSRRRGNSGAPPRPGFPPPGGAGPESPWVGGGAGPGARGSAGVAAVRVSAPGSPGWVPGVPSAFREGDSATRSRIEKLRETENERRELGRQHLLTEPRCAPAQVRSRTCGPLLPTPLRNWRGEGRAELQLQRRGHTMRGREQRQERRVPRRSWV